MPPDRYRFLNYNPPKEYYILGSCKAVVNSYISANALTCRGYARSKLRTSIT